MRTYIRAYIRISSRFAATFEKLNTEPHDHPRGKKKAVDCIIPRMWNPSNKQTNNRLEQGITWNHIHLLTFRNQTN